MPAPFSQFMQLLVIAQIPSQFGGNSPDAELFGANTRGLVGLGIVAALLAVGGVVFYVLKNRPKPKINDLTHLFRELCDSHQLGRRHRELLLRFAKNRKISNPCMLFVDSALWQAAQVVVGAGARQHPDQPKLDRLKKTLYSPAKTTLSAG